MKKISILLTHSSYISLQEGSVGHELVIRPVPLEVSKSDDGSAHHVVFKRNSEEDEHLHQHEQETMSDYAYMEPDRLSKRYRRSYDDYEEERTRSKRQIPHIIYPEILVIVDYDGYRLHNGDNVQIKRYFVSFWNGVDLRYRLLKGPKIRISIAGIIISRVSRAVLFFACKMQSFSWHFLLGFVRSSWAHSLAFCHPSHISLELNIVHVET